MQFDQLLQYTLSGLSTGAIYALIGIGFSIIYNATGIINFAQGEFVMLGGMLTLLFLETLKLPLWAAIPCAIAASTVAGLLFERLAIRPLRQPTPINLVIITIGGSILIRGLVMLMWGKDTHAIPPFSGDDPISIAGATILPQHLWQDVKPINFPLSELNTKPIGSGPFALVSLTDTTAELRPAASLLVQPSGRRRLRSRRARGKGLCVQARASSNGNRSSPPSTTAHLKLKFSPPFAR